MKTINTVLSVLLLQVLVWYGWTYSVTDHAWMIQGYIGASVPAVIGGLLFFYGRFSAVQS